MRKIVVLFIIVAGVLLAGNKAEAAQQLPGMGDPVCKEAKPVEDLVRVPVVRSCDKDNNGANDCAGKNPYQCSLHCMGLEGVDLDFSMRMTVAQGDGTCARLNLGGTLVWKGAVGPGNDRPGDVYVDPRKPLPSGMLLFGAYQDREILVATHVDYCDDALGNLARCKSERDRLAARVTELEKGQPPAVAVVAVPPAPQSKIPSAGSIEAAADQGTMLVAEVQTKLTQAALGATALFIMALVLLVLWLRALRELRRCRGWLEQIRTAADVDAETHYRDIAAVISRSLSDGNAALVKLRREILDALAIGSLRSGQRLAGMVQAMREKGGVAVDAMSQIAEAVEVELGSMGDVATYEGQARVVVAAVAAAKSKSDSHGPGKCVSKADHDTALADHGAGKCVAQSVHDVALAGHHAGECVPKADHDTAVARLDAVADNATALRAQLAEAERQLADAREQLEQRVLRSEFDALDQRVKAQGAEISRLNRLEAAMREMHELVPGVEAIRDLLQPLPGHRGPITVTLKKVAAKGHCRTLRTWLDVMGRNPMPAFAGD